MASFVENVRDARQVEAVVDFVQVLQLNILELVSVLAADSGGRCLLGVNILRDRADSLEALEAVVATAGHFMPLQTSVVDDRLRVVDSDRAGSTVLIVAAILRPVREMAHLADHHVVTPLAGRVFEPPW